MSEHSALATRHAAEEALNAIQARVLPTDALEIVDDDEAAQYVGSYIK